MCGGTFYPYLRKIGCLLISDVFWWGTQNNGEPHFFYWAICRTQFFFFFDLGTLLLSFGR